MSGLGLDCTFCHRNVDKGATASVPPVEQCIFCHKIVGTDLPEVVKLVNAWDNKEAVAWERVHRLPDSVRFVHEAHIRYFTQQGNLLQSGEQATIGRQRVLHLPRRRGCNGPKSNRNGVLRWATVWTAIETTALLQTAPHATTRGWTERNVMGITQKTVLAGGRGPRRLEPWSSTAVAYRNRSSR